MQLLAITLGLLAVAPRVLAHDGHDLSTCVEDCQEANLVSSQCDGDEEGEEEEICVCNSFANSLLLECVKECTDEEQSMFVGHVIPESCQESLFPGITPTEEDHEDHEDHEGHDEEGGDSEESTEDDPDAAAGLGVSAGLLAAGLAVAMLL